MQLIKTIHRVVPKCKKVSLIELSEGDYIEILVYRNEETVEGNI